MKKIFLILCASLFVFDTYAQESLKNYLVNSDGKTSLRYEWTGKSTQPTNMYTIRTVTIEGNTVLIKEIIEFNGETASEMFYSCSLKNNELKAKTIVSDNVLTGHSERIVEQILLKLPIVGQTLKWVFIDERDGVKYSYSVKRTMIDNKKALEISEVIDGLNVVGYTYYVYGIGFYKKTMKSSNGQVTTMMVLKE